MKKQKINQRYHVTGTVDMKGSGVAYILSPDLQHDIFIPKDRTGNAMHGDTVKVLVKRTHHGERPEGEIVEILERGKSTYSGTIQIADKYAFVMTDSNRVPVDIFIPPQNIHNAKDGQKVVVHVTGWRPNDKNPTGEIIDVLGMPGEHQAEMNSIIEEYGLPLKFPDKVQRAVEELKTRVTPEEIGRRRDFRNIMTFTIDPADAKDFDDALSIKKLDNGNWEIGVHIADVSHYVELDSPIDREAEARGTSVYLVDRVIPMLP